MLHIKPLFSGNAGDTGKPVHPLVPFAILWALVFALYWPAARAGFVTDFTGWLDQVQHHSFSDFINRTHFKAKSPYQLTQLNTYIGYKLLGTNPWLWHLLFVTLHALNATLLFRLCAQLLAQARSARSQATSFAGALLFCISPYMSEVIVWEPSFHFLQGLLLILLILLCIQMYVQHRAPKYMFMAWALYALSLFSLEIFYITPWLVLSLAIFFRFHVNDGKTVCNKVLQLFFAPLLLLFVIRFVGYRLYSGDWFSRIGAGTVDSVTILSFSKPAKYLFHLLCIGRFFPEETRRAVYTFFDSLAGIVAFYGFIGLLCILVVAYFKKMSGTLRAALLLFIWMMAALLLLVPLWFQADMLVYFDRYIYFAGAFFYMLFAVLVSLISISYLRVAILVLFALVNLRFAIQASRYWGKSERIVSALLQNIPDAGNKTVILLNLPQNMHGVPMIGAEKNSEYKLMHDLLIPGKPITNTVYDAMAYNMLTPDDGAHVNVINDSMIKVTLNQWGTWWWFETRGGYSYWTTDYKLDLKDPGHWYELTLRKPADQYLLLYNVGDRWKAVDMNKKDGDQN